MCALLKLKQNYEFRRLYGRGKTMVTPFCVIYRLKNKYGTVRLGITAGKKLGTAVARNRAKRVITAAFRTCLPHIPPGNDFVIVARTRILSVKSTAVAAAIKRQLESAGLWVDDEPDCPNPD